MKTLPTVLIVDDEVRSLESLQRILVDDFEVELASNVQEAEALLETEWLQIIRCDQRKPDTTGVEFLTRVRVQWPDVIRTIISGYTGSENINALNDAGVYQSTTKPGHPHVAARFRTVPGNAAREVLPARADSMHLMGLPAGKWQHSRVTLPGGTTC